MCRCAAVISTLAAVRGGGCAGASHFASTSPAADLLLEAFFMESIFLVWFGWQSERSSSFAMSFIALHTSGAVLGATTHGWR